MIIGECPSCDALVTNGDGVLGKMSKHKCEECKKTYWLLHSYLEPIAYSECCIEVNEEAKSVKVKKDHICG